MKKAAKRSISRYPKLRSKVKSKPNNSLLMLAILIIAVVGFVVWAVIANNPGKTPHAEGTYQLSPPLVSGITATFSIWPVITTSNIALVVKSTSSNFWPTYQSPAISGSSVRFTDARIDSYNAKLVSLDRNGLLVADASNTVTFNVSGYTLSSPIISGKTATFTISPAITDSNIYLLVAQYAGPGVYKTGTIKGNYVLWDADLLGGYQAFLVSLGPNGSNASNTVLFNISGGQIDACLHADVDHNGFVNLSDVLLVKDKVGTSKKDANFNAVYDVNQNGAVTLADVLVVNNLVGQHC